MSRNDNNFVSIDSANAKANNNYRQRTADGTTKTNRAIIKP